MMINDGQCGTIVPPLNSRERNVYSVESDVDDDDDELVQNETREIRF